MGEHHLKLDKNYFDAVASGDKNFEVRRDDRGFQKGDVLHLHKYGTDWMGKTGYLKGGNSDLESVSDTISARITYILTGGQFGIETGFVVMGIVLLTAAGEAGNG
jgi:hypothetical protein